LDSIPDFCGLRVSASRDFVVLTIFIASISIFQTLLCTGTLAGPTSYASRKVMDGVRLEGNLNPPVKFVLGWVRVSFYVSDDSKNSNLHKVTHGV
jgi:hypothetical protein